MEISLAVLDLLTCGLLCLLVLTLTFGFLCGNAASAESGLLITDLSDAGLTEIFKRLPPCDRLLASEICRRWRDLSRMPWLDIRHVTLDTIPSEHIGAIVKLCPNLRSISAVGKSFKFRALHCLPEAARCLSVQLYDCRVETVPGGSLVNPSDNLFCGVFSYDLSGALWNELTLHNLGVVGIPKRTEFPWCIYGYSLPSTLTHLQLTGLRCDSNAAGFHLYPLKDLQNLECLVLHSSPNDEKYRLFSSFDILEVVAPLKNLRELSISPAPNFSIGLQLGQFVTDMPKLEVLFLIDVSPRACSHLNDVIRKPSALRILVLAGHFDTDYPGVPDRIEIQARPATLSTLHIFVGESAAAKMHFAHSSKAFVYLMVEPMPHFLKREKIATIFSGVWIAKQINETAKCNERGSATRKYCTIL